MKHVILVAYVVDFWCGLHMQNGKGEQELPQPG